MHSAVLVIATAPSAPVAPESLVEPLLAPYSEHLEVDPYEVPCYCISDGASATEGAQQSVKPDPDCEYCGGTGVESVTWNPERRWDYWGIGGRFTGLLDPGYDPAREASKYEHCDAVAMMDIPPLDALRSEPRAIVTPDGLWHEAHVEGGEFDDEEWRTRARELIEAHRRPGLIAAVVDCHC